MKTMKKVLSVILVTVMLLTAVPLENFNIALKASADDYIFDYCEYLNNNINTYAQECVFWENQISQNKRIVDAIKYGEKAIDICIDTATSLTFSIIPGYGAMEWVEWALARGIDALELAIYHSIIGTAKSYIEKGDQYRDYAHEKFMANQKYGEIKSANVAYEIDLNYKKAIAYYDYGNGFYQQIINSFVEERSNKALFYTKKSIEHGINFAIDAASPMLKDMFPKLNKIVDTLKIDDLYDLLTITDWNLVISSLLIDNLNTKSFTKFSNNLKTIEITAQGLYNNSFARPTALSMTYKTSASYDLSIYKRALENINLSGDQRMDIVNVALSQVGYHEGNSTEQLNGKNTSGSKNYTEYGYWFGNQVLRQSSGFYEPWCAMFISWCARQAGIPTSIISNASCARADGSSAKGGNSYFHVNYKNRGNYTPQPGDLIFFGNWDHVGIVYKVADGKVYTVEGNNDNCVKKTWYYLSNPYIKCYGIPNYTSSIGIPMITFGAYLLNSYNNRSFYKAGTYRITARSGLNARSQPNANSTRVSGWGYGDTVEVTATDGNWGYTSRGWICLDYAELVSGTTSSYNSTVNYDVGNYVVTTPSGLNCRKGVGTNYGVIKTLTNGTHFSVTKTDGAWGYSPEHGGWLCLQYALYVSALTPNLPVPALPNLSTTTSSEIGVGEVISFKWDAVDTAESYHVKLIDANTNAEVQAITVSGTNASFKAPYEGKFNVSVSASNSQHKGPAATLFGFYVKAPSTVTFKDWDGKVISTQEVAYGKDATAPATPSRVGYTFSKWDGDFNAVREDRTITATYTRNKYKVTFCDYDGTVIGTQDVYYGDAATAPAYSAPTGYSFVKWDTDFDNITKETTVKAVISWTSLYPLEISTSSAVQRNNKSYIVTSIVNNSPNAVNNARIIAVLKTKENKLLATVQSENISLAKGEVKNLTLTASYEGMATKAEIFVVKADNENIPLAKQLTKDVDQGTAWSAWSTSQAPADAVLSESRTEYRYRDKQFTTDTSSSLSGWTLRTDITNPTVSYGAWSGWSAWQDSAIGETDVCDVETQQVTVSQGYTQYRYSRLKSTSTTHNTFCPHAQRSGQSYVREYTAWSTTRIPVSDWWECSICGMFYTYATQDNDPNGYHWYYTEESQWVDTSYTKTQYRYRTRSKTTTYHFYKWSDWSSWSTNAVSANANKEVENRTVFRYLANTTNNIETTAGKFIERTGTVDKAYANRQALLFVMDKNGTSQFVGQTIIGTDGSYAFKFKTKDEPTVTSGDYKVMLSIEGTSAAFELEPIKAPVPQYTVKFVDHDGTVVSMQTVKQGEDAIVPAPLSREGYRFIGWDKAFTNIQGNTTLTAQYEIKTFDVVFVDEINDTSATVKYNYGDTLVHPEVTLNDAYNFLGWDAVMNGTTVVKENMVVTAKFEKKMFTVDFLDFDGSILESKSVEYGDAVAESVLLNRDNYVFISWSPSSDLNYVTEDITVTPIFEYAETVLAPTANITTGAFDEELIVTLSSETEGAKIYYTTDGTVPNVSDTSFKAERTDYDVLPKSNGILYTEPFTIDSSAKLIYVAVKDGMNNSGIEQEVYVVNTKDSIQQQHLVSVHCNTTGETTNYIVDDGKTLPELDMDLDENGYDLVGLYTDAEFENEWNLSTDIVTSNMDIYLKWEKETYSVKFLDFDGNVISEQNVRYMEDATVPKITNVDGYVFKYWSTGYTHVIKDITVKAIYAAASEVTTVSLNKNALTLIEGSTETLSPSISLGTDCTNDALIWQSSDEDVAIVDDNGKITAVAAGKAIIFAISEDSGMSAQCEVTVEYEDPCAALGHSEEVIPGKDATCTETGLTEGKKCTVCGVVTVEQNETPALGHAYDSGVVTKAATCTATGVKTFSCAHDASHTYTETIEKLAHKKVTVNKADATATEDGYTGDVICSVCDELLAEGKVIPATGEQNNCSHMCHQGGFMGFIWKIVRIFWKLFKMNPICECGVAHY